MSPAERRAQAKEAVETSWARTADRPGRTRAARDAADARFERQAREIHPDGSDELIAQAAAALRKAHIARMTRNSLKSRNAKKAAGKTPSK